MVGIMAEKQFETMWAIYNPNFGLYTGTFLTRSDAIDDHVKSFYGVLDKQRNKYWRERRKRGDRLVNVEMIYYV